MRLNKEHWERERKKLCENGAVSKRLMVNI